MTLGSRYQLGDMIYSDSTLTVRRGNDTVLHRVVTIQQLQPQAAADPEIVGRFLDAARALALIELPNVAALYDQGEIDGQPFLIFEEALPNEVATAAPLPLDVIIRIVQAIAETARLASERSTRLPPITPQTVRFAPDGRVQILQTGLAAPVATRSTNSALARLVAAALTGSTDGKGTIQQPPAIRRVIERALADKYASPDALLHDLRAAQQQATAETQAVPKPEPQPRPPTPESVRPQVAPPPQPFIPDSEQPAVDTFEPEPATDFVTRLRQLPQRGKIAIGVVLAVLVLMLAIGLSRRPDATAANTPPQLTPALRTPGTIGTAAPGQATTAAQGQAYVVQPVGNNRLNVRAGAGTNFGVVATVSQGTVVQVIEGPVNSSGYNWVHIQATGVDGWCILEGLRKQ